MSNFKKHVHCVDPKGLVSTNQKAQRSSLQGLTQNRPALWTAAALAKHSIATAAKILPAWAGLRQLGAFSRAQKLRSAGLQ
jgi:hypothetical protein